MALNLETAVSNVEEMRLASLDELTFLPEPEPRELWCPVISVDDHLLEPASLFDRVPKHLRDRAPFMKEVEGRPMWHIGDLRFPLIGIDGAAGRPMPQTRVQGLRFSDFRPGVYDVDARVADMDLNGVWASLCFPSVVWGFAGTRLSKLPDPELALACIRSYNDWMLEDWCGSHPDRFIPNQLPYLADPQIAAEEIRRNADRGFRAVSFSENPYGLGYPSIHSGHWDPFLQACADTGTVINLHVGSSGSLHQASPDASTLATSALFPINGIEAAIDWVFSKIPIRYPNIKIAMSEAGMSWVPMLYERLQVAYDRRHETTAWDDDDPTPMDLMRRNIWFTSIEDPAGFRMLDLVGADRVMLEVDFPHPDGTWPNSQEIFRHQLESHPDETIKQVCYATAAKVYQHPEPPQELIDRAAAFARTPA